MDKPKKPTPTEAQKKSAAARRSWTEIKPETPRQRSFFRYYLDKNNPHTFMHGVNAARAAGYKDNYKALSVASSKNKKRYAHLIEKWLAEEGLDTNSLKSQLVELIRAKETKTFQLKGTVVNRDQLPEGARIICVAENQRVSQNGIAYEEAETLLALDVEALEVRRRSLDMALKLQEMYPSEKHDHNLKGNVTLIMELTPEDDGDSSE